MTSHNFWQFSTLHPPTFHFYLLVSNFGGISDSPSPPKIEHHWWTLPKQNYYYGKWHSVKHFKGHFSSVAKVALRFVCAKQSKKISNGIYCICIVHSICMCYFYSFYCSSYLHSSHPVAASHCTICIFANQYWPSIAELYLPAVSLHCMYGLTRLHHQ